MARSRDYDKFNQMLHRQTRKHKSWENEEHDESYRNFNNRKVSDVIEEAVDAV